PRQWRARGGRPLGQRVHRPLLSPDLRRMVAELGFARRRPGRQPRLSDRALPRFLAAMARVARRLRVPRDKGAIGGAAAVACELVNRPRLYLGLGGEAEAGLGLGEAAEDQVGGVTADRGPVLEAVARAGADQHDILP